MGHRTGMATTILFSMLWLAAAGAPADEPQGSAQPSFDEPTFDQLVAGAEARRGLFDTYRKGDHLYLAIPPARFGKELLVVPRIARGIGARGLHAGTNYDRLEAEVVVLERHGERVFLKQLPHRFTADPGTPQAVAVGRSFSASVLAAAKVAAERADGTVLVDVHPWVVSDLFNVERFVRESLGEAGKPASVSLDAERSHLEWVKAYPENLEIRSVLTFRPSAAMALDTVPDARFLPLAMHFSFIEPAAEPMASRPADDRIGFTLSVRKDFSRRGDWAAFERIANRWRLEPGEKVGDRFRPKKPIVFHLDPSIPDIYRPHVRAAIEAWNRAFEAAGFEGAIRAEPLPPEAEPADARFATVTWVAAAEEPFGAFGNSIVDPRTGEILDADVVIDGGMVESAYPQWRALVAPRRDGLAGDRPAHEGDHFADGVIRGAALGRLALAARGEGAPPAQNPAADDPAADDPAARELVGQLVEWVVLHELGHDIGLDHNFHASAATPISRLHDRSWTDAHGLAASVMDYLPINLAPLGQPNGDYYLTQPGPYDRWAISYLYGPDPERARALLRENAESFHVYGGDIDLYAPGALDPLTSANDLSDDPLAWIRQRTELVRQILPRLPAVVLTDGARYGELAEAVEILSWEHFRALGSAVRQVGGRYAFKDHVGDAGGRPPFVPVPKATQRAALDLLAREAFGPDAFAVPLEVLRKMGARHWDHWGHPGTYDGRIDPPYLGRLGQQQAQLLAELTDPLRLAKMVDAEHTFGRDAVLSLPELLNGLAEVIWQELWTPPVRQISASRRDLQRAWLERMSYLLLDADARLPADARSLARAVLADLSHRLADALAAPGLDAYTRAHLAEAAARIERVLEAQVTAPSLTAGGPAP